MKTLQFEVFKNLPMNVDQTSAVIDLNGIYGYFLQWQYTGTATGNIICMGSVDGITYYDITTDALSANKGFKNQDAAYWRYLKVMFDRTTGLVSETINAQIFLKGI